MSPATAENLRKYVADGGTLIVSFFSGIVDECERIHLGGYPGLLRDVLGITVEEWEPYPEGTANTLLFPDGSKVSSSYFNDLLHCDSASALANFDEDFFAGYPALTENQYKKGKAYYVATRPDKSWLKSWISGIATNAGITAPLNVPAGVEVTRRIKTDGSEFLFILNHNTNPVRIDDSRLEQSIDLLSGNTLNRGNYELAPYGVACFKG
jgi:beta-galactosidase